MYEEAQVVQYEEAEYEENSDVLDPSLAWMLGGRLYEDAVLVEGVKMS